MRKSPDGPKSPAGRRPPVAPSPGEGKRGEQGHLGYLLRQAGAAHRLAMERALADQAVTPPQFGVLTVLNAYPGISNADIARLTLQSPQTLSVIIANLERAGSVVRTAHAVHGRIQHVDLTPAGRRLLVRCKERVQAVEDRMVEGLAQRDEAVIRRWLVWLAVGG